MENNKLGIYLNKVRTKTGFSLRKVAEETGISASYINRVEKGERKNISITMLQKFSEFYRIPVQELYKVAGIDIKTQPNTIELMALNAEYVVVSGQLVNTLDFQSFISNVITLDTDKTEDVLKLIQLTKNLQKTCK